MTSLKCLIIDDEKPARELLQQYCSDVPFIEVVGECKNAFETMNLLATLNPDLLFLDIKMPKLSGIQLLRTLNNPPLVIITTAFREYAFDGFELDVADYLKKPFSYERFLKAVMKVKMLKEQKNATNDMKGTVTKINDSNLFIKADNILHRIDIGNLMYVEAMGDYSNFVTDREKFVIYTTMKNTESLLPKESFIRVHRSYIVSVKFIKYIEGNRIFLENKEIQIGKSYREAVLRLLTSS